MIFDRTKEVRLRVVCNLIFFVCLILSSCSEKTSDIKILWTDGKATGISIPRNSIGNISGSPEQSMIVHLVTEQQPVAMMGNYKATDDEIIFEPLIPFTRGMHYAVRVNDKQISTIEIPAAHDLPALITVYPTGDTVPENLLKIYLHFSKPMQEGVSAKYITLLQNQDTVHGAFLDLQPELWNEDRTLLTIWLDPGRIKRDLIPNKRLGTPLLKGNRYSVVVSNRWKDTQGLTLMRSFTKEFFVEDRDSISPDPKRWKLHVPASGSTEGFSLEFNAPLDYSLLMSTMSVVNESGKKIDGRWQLGDEEERMYFTPAQHWPVGHYVLQVETRLEDLAGNNLNRLFDEDISRGRKPSPMGAFVSIDFFVK